MLSVFEFAASPFDRLLLDVAVKAAVVLAAAWGVCRFLAWCRSPAAARHLAWSLALACVLALPLLTATLPAWDVAISWPQGSTPIVLETPIEQLDLAAAPEAFGAVAQSVEPQVQQAATEPPTGRRWNISWIFCGWLIGCIASLTPLCLGLASLWSLAQRSRRVSSGPLADALDAARAHIGAKQPVRLLQSASRSMPMTWGLVRPTILLPEGAELWSDDRLRAVLLHELAHVERRDCLTQRLAQVVRAIYWFNPLAWLAERQLHIAQEQACDDRVLGQGFDAAEYAQHLFEVLAGVRSPAGVSAVASAMARAATIEERLRCILSASQNRRPVSRRRLGLATITAMALFASLSVLQFEVEPAVAEEPQAQPAKQASAKTLAELRTRIAERYVTPVDEGEVERGAIKGMIAALCDPYSDYLSPEMMAEIEKQIGGTRVGIGVQLDLHEQRIRVVTPLADSPALKAGIQPGDVIRQIDGHPAGSDLGEAVKRIAGAQGTVVKLTLGRGAGQEVELSITRNPIKLPSVKGFRRGADDQWELLLDAKRKVGYVQIAQFGTATPAEVRDALDSLKKQEVQGLILDLRFCPGGTLDAAVETARLLLKGGTIVSLHSRDQAEMKMTADAAGPFSEVPLLVLVNGQTASAAEVVTGALQDNRRAVVLGTRTLGKGSVQTIIKLDEGSGAVKLTTAQYRLPSGRNIDRRPDSAVWGVNPDEGFFVPLDAAQTKALLAKRLEREIIGRKPDQRPDAKAEVTPQWLEAEQADPQLAAALKAFAGRLARGEFAKVSQHTPAQVEQFLKREDVERRRVAVLENLNRLNQELADLEKEGAASKPRN